MDMLQRSNTYSYVRNMHIYVRHYGKVLRAHLKNWLRNGANMPDIRNALGSFRAEVLEKWIRSHLICNKNPRPLGGHGWKHHYWDSDLEVWVWICKLCDEVNIRTTMGNSIWVRRFKNKLDKTVLEYEALIVTDQFAQPEKLIRKVFKDLHKRQYPLVMLY